MATLWKIIFIPLLIFLPTVYSFSACDEIDITFVIDADSIMANSNAIIKFITSIIWSGSSEHTGFSAVIYGNTIPIDQHIKIISLYDTQSTVLREQEQQLVTLKLNKAFNELKQSNSETKSVDLISAFKIATGQSVPKHSYHRKQLLGYKTKDTTIGDHDGQKAYFIFDNNNKLLKNAYEPEICNLFYHLDNNAIANDDEAVYFLFGNPFIRRHVMNILCNSHPVSYIKRNTFYHFTTAFAFNEKRMEHIYMLTCPAEIKCIDYNGEINVGNHVQYMDNTTIISCDLFYWDHDNDQSTPNELDRHRSYIKIKDYISDDNTFKLFDYLIAYPNSYENIRRKGCRDSVYKIIQMQHLQKVYGKTDKEKYKILLAFVRLPDTPMEYMSEANVFGKVPIHKYESNNKGPTVNPDEKEHKERVKYNGIKTSAHTVMEYNEIDILKGEMNDIMNENIVLKTIGNNILNYRIKKLKKIAKRAVNAKKSALRLLSQLRKKRHISNGIFGAKLMEEEFLGKVGKFFKKAGQKIKKTATKVFKKVKGAIKKVVKTVGNLVAGKVAFNKRFKLVDLKFKKDWTFIKTGKIEKTFGSTRDKGFKIVINGDGTIELKFGYHFKLEVGVYFNFYWKIFKSDIRIQFKIYGQWDIGAYFNAKFIGKLSILFDNILNFGKTKVFFIGPVPVVVRPYIIIYAEIVTLPINIYGGINCQYSERIELGYEYNKRGKKGPIKTRRIIKKECVKKFGVGDSDNGKELNKCPVEKLGFDVKISVKIGCSLYVIINVFLRMEFVLPFRITLPEMDVKMCKLPVVHSRVNGNQMCRRKYLKVGFSIAMNLNIYLGVSLDIDKVWSFIKRLMFKKKTSGKAISPKAEKKIIGPIKIIPKKSLGCLDMKGILKSLNEQYKPICCAPPPTPQFVIGITPPKPTVQKQIHMPNGRNVNVRQQMNRPVHRAPMHRVQYPMHRPVFNRPLHGQIPMHFNQGYGQPNYGYGQQQFNMYGQMQSPYQNMYNNYNPNHNIYGNGYNNNPNQNMYGNGYNAPNQNIYGSSNTYRNGDNNGYSNRYSNYGQSPLNRHSNYGQSPLNRHQMSYETPNYYQNYNDDHDSFNNDNHFQVIYEYAYENPINIMSSEEDDK